LKGQRPFIADLEVESDFPAWFFSGNDFDLVNSRSGQRNRFKSLRILEFNGGIGRQGNFDDLQIWNRPAKRVKQMKREPFGFVYEKVIGNECFRVSIRGKKSGILEKDRAGRNPREQEDKYDKQKTSHKILQKSETRNIASDQRTQTLEGNWVLRVFQTDWPSI